MGFESWRVSEPLVAVLALYLQATLLAKLDLTHGQTKVEQVPQVGRALPLLLRYLQVVLYLSHKVRMHRFGAEGVDHSYFFSEELLLLHQFSQSLVLVTVLLDVGVLEVFQLLSCLLQLMFDPRQLLLLEPRSVDLVEMGVLTVLLVHLYQLLLLLLVHLYNHGCYTRLNIFDQRAVLCLERFELLQHSFSQGILHG